MPNESGIFHDQVIQTLTRLESGQERIIERLDIINGSVSTLFKIHTETEIKLAEHPSKCDLRNKIDVVKRQLTSGDYVGSNEVRKRLDEFENRETRRIAAKETSRAWITWLRPVINFVAVALSILVALHINEIMKRWIK